MFADLFAWLFLNIHVGLTYLALGVAFVALLVLAHLGITFIRQKR